MAIWAKVTFKILFLIAEWTAALSRTNEVYSHQVRQLKDEVFEMLEGE